MTTILHHPDGSVRIERNEASTKYRLSVEPRDGLYVQCRTWETAYTLDLIEHVFRVTGPSGLCDEIRRDEDPLYVQRALKWDITSYLGEESFAGRRVLDFGSGMGASSMVLARLLPLAAEIIGVELFPNLMELARHRARFYDVDDRVHFHLSPDPTGLPANCGRFDYMVLSGVYEHLLPDERRILLPLLWLHLKPGGIIFLDQTPYRWFPIEFHTTSLPLINYLPDRLAFACARRFSKRVRPNRSWSDLLRAGIRGATLQEIMRIVNRDGREGKILSPSRFNVKNRIELWYKFSSAKRWSLAKKLVMWGFKAIKATTGVSMLPIVALAIQKVR